MMKKTAHSGSKAEDMRFVIWVILDLALVFLNVAFAFRVFSDEAASLMLLSSFVAYCALWICEPVDQ